MSNTLILLPGWSFSPSVLEPLAQAIQRLAPEFEVQLEPLPRCGSAQVEDWLADLDQRLPADCWLGGWSLGGMLAMALAAQRGEACSGVLTFASNARFVACADWPNAMTPEVFSSFYQGVEANAPSALKRFDMLCSQGCSEPRQLARLLAQHHSDETEDQRLAGLQVLARLDNRAAFQQFAGHQWHGLAAQDALLPSGLIEDLKRLCPQGAVPSLEGMGHAALLEHPDQLAAHFVSVMQGKPHVL